MHISDISPGDFVRIRVSTNKSMVYKPAGVGGYELVYTRPQKRDKVWSSALLTGTVIGNEPEEGILRLSVANLQEADNVYRATVPYVAMSIIQVGVVDIQHVTVPEYLKGVPLQPRIKYERVKF